MITGNDLETSKLQYSVSFCISQRTTLSMQIYTLFSKNDILKFQYSDILISTFIHNTHYIK